MTGVIFLQILSIAIKAGSFIYGIFASKSKAAPIIAALTPFILKAMKAAEEFFGDGNGQSKLVIAENMIETAVDAGLVVSAGGQKHTMEELKAAMPEIRDTITAVVTVIKGTNIESLQPSS